jgi:hypothetical protein
MKKYLVGVLSVVLVAAAGCGDENTPLAPGDPMDTDFQEFSQQFDAMDQGVGLMAEMAFDTIDNIMAQNPQAGGVVNLSSEFALELIWDEATSSWVGSLSYDDGNGTTFSATNSVQLLEGATPVQYPDENALSEIKSSIEMDAVGENFEYAAAQNVSFKLGPDDIVDMTGSGEFHVNLTAVIESQTGTSTCTFQSQFATTFTNVAINTGETVTCPVVGGSVRFAGQVASECTGEVTGSSNKSWSVTRRWNEAGGSTTDFISGGNIWTVEEACS